MQGARLSTIHALFLASGATALVYQVAWARDLSLVFGASFEAQSIVLAAFMAGLAAGGFSFGRAVQRFARPLRLYGLLEIGVGLFALALPSLLSGVDALYLAIARESGTGHGALVAARAALAFAVLVLPTFCMGGTLPVLVRYGVQREGEFGERMSGLYAINTLGAVVGTLAAGFVLLPGIGVWRSELLTALANLSIGGLAIAIDRRLATRARAELEPEPTAPPAAATLPAAAHGSAVWPYRLAFGGTAVAGMASLALEVSWSRAIAIATGANVYSFSVMLATFLSGISIGAQLHGRTPIRRLDPSVQLGWTLAAIGVASAVVSLLIPYLPELALRFAVMLYGAPAGIRVETTFVLCFAVMLVPCILMGLAFPLAGEARARLDPRFGAAVGDLVGLNTLGAILGSLLAGFVAIPRLGLQRTMGLAAAAYCAYGLLVLCAAWGARRPERRSLAWAAAATAIPAAAALLLSLPRWDMQSFTGFPNSDLGFFLNADGEVDFGRARAENDLLYAREGRGSTVSVIGNDGFRSMLIDGRVVASDSLDDMQHEYLLGHLPVQLHPNPKSAAVIGLGAGLTLGGVAAEESLERIVVVEIEPAVRGGTQLFADLHDDALADPRVELTWQDGRNYLLTTAERFDVITADPIHPWAQGGGYLYTTEYYRILADHLAPGGIVCQWLPLYELSEADVESAVATFLERFEYATLWQASSDALLIGSNAPIGVDLDALAARLAKPRVSRQLARIGLDAPLSFLAEFTMDREAMERYAQGATINTDDNLHLEFSSPYAMGAGGERNVLQIDGFRVPAGPVVRAAGARAQLDADLANLRAAKSQMIRAAPLWTERMGRPTLEGVGELASVYRAALEQAPGYRQAQLRLAFCYATLGELHLEQGESETALELFHRALALDPGNVRANLRVGIAWVEQGQLERALENFEAAIGRSLRSVDAQAAAGETLTRLGRYEDALVRLRTATALRPDLAEPQRLVCACLRELGEIEAALEACRAAHALAPNEPRTALDFANTLIRAGRHRDAVATLRDALARDRSRLALRLRLAWLLSTSPDPGARDGRAAVELLAATAQHTSDPRVLDVFAAALAEAGRFEQAADTAARGAELARAAGRAALAERLRARDADYRAGRPLREGG